MKRLILMAGLSVLPVLAVIGPRPAAAEPSGPEVVIAQLKVTSGDGQFVSLYNTSSQPLDMGRYELQYFNNYDLARTTSTKLVRLKGTVPAHGYFMLSDDTLTVCYRTTVQSASLGFSTAAGLVQLVRLDQTRAGSAVSGQVQDYVGWSKAGVSGVQTLPEDGAFLHRLPADSDGAPTVAVAGGGSWQAAMPSADGCGFTSEKYPSNTGSGALLSGDDPPTAEPTAQSDLPATNRGLQAPLVTELLPNPGGTGNDGTDEFVELYNPNQTAFDLSGFTLEAGLSSLHDYAFPAGTALAPHAYAAFTSAKTHLSLSNTAGQLKLLDPGGKLLSSSDKYQSAKDDVAWALANGHWQWTTKPTPGAPNSVLAPATPKSRTKPAATTSTRTDDSSSKSADASPASQVLEAVPVHPAILVAVGLLALLYGAYEYRNDIRNRYLRARRDRAARRELGAKVARR